MMKRIGVNSVVGIIFIIFSLFWNTLINNLPQGTKLAAYGPRFFPRIVTSSIIIIAILLIIQDMFSKNEKIKFIYEKADALMVIGLIAVMIAYLLVMPIFGYLVSTIAALAAILWLFGLRDIKTFILVSVLFPVLSNVLFHVVLKVNLP